MHVICKIWATLFRLQCVHWSQRKKIFNCVDCWKVFWLNTFKIISFFAALKMTVTLTAQTATLLVRVNLYIIPGSKLTLSPSLKFALFSKGTHICLMKSLIIMFPVCHIVYGSSLQDPILKMLSSNTECTYWSRSSANCLSSSAMS